MSWRLGRICGVQDQVELEKAVIVAEVFSRALSPEDGGLIATYFLVHDLEPDQAERAMEFFSAQPSMLVDTARLVEECGAEYPACVAIRHTPETAEYLASALEWDFLRLLPGDDVISREGWDIFCALDAMQNGQEIDPADPLPSFDNRALRRKVFANRASIEEDCFPWLKAEAEALRKVTEHGPDGSEGFVAQAEDIEAVLRGEVVVGETYSIIIPTTVERMQMRGAIRDWVAQAGREIVVAHGLNALQAARAYKVVFEDPQAFVDKDHLLAGSAERERLCAPLLVRDSGLNWMSTDFTGRRDAAGYGRLQVRLNGTKADVFTQARPLASNER